MTLENLLAQSQSNYSATKQVFYYNSVWELTDPEKSFYKREAYFDLKNIEFDGIYRDYDNENHLIADGSYSHGEKSGIHTQYNKDFSVKSKVEYNGNDFIIWELPQTDKSESVKNGTGKFTVNYYYVFERDTRMLWKQGVMEGEFRNGKRVGSWKYFDNPKDESLTEIETYNNGKFLGRIHYANGNSVETNTPKIIYLSLDLLTTESLIHDKQSFANLNEFFEKNITYPNYFQREVSFPKGYKHLLTLLMNLVGVPESYMELLQVKIDAHGKVLKTTVARSVSSSADDFALRAFALYDNRILPAIKNGKAIETTIFIPISGGERWASALKDFSEEWFFDVKNFTE